MNDNYDQRVSRAVQEYFSRQNRESHPEGNFDNKARWYPCEGEERGCCSNIRRPSAAYPYSLMLHCRTMKHIANLYGVNYIDLKREVSLIRRGFRVGYSRTEVSRIDI